MPLGASLPPQDGEGVEGVRVKLEKLVETRRVIAKEKSDWKLGKQLLEDRIELLRGEIEALRERKAAAETGIGETAAKRAELEGRLQELKDSSAVLSERVVEFEGRLRALLKRLPEPLLDQVEPLTQRIPEEGAQEIKLSLGQRFESLVGILNMSDKFNREIQTASEVRELPNGRSAEVSSIYIGLGQAYFVSIDGQAAGMGVPTENGWSWTPATHAAKDIARAIQIVNGEKPAEFVPLPVRID